MKTLARLLMYWYQAPVRLLFVQVIFLLPLSPHFTQQIAQSIAPFTSYLKSNLKHFTRRLLWRHTLISMRGCRLSKRARIRVRSPVGQDPERA